MACTTILVGKKASYDGSTMIARNEDAMFEPKRMEVVTVDKIKRKYKSTISHLEIDLPKNPMRYTCNPNMDVKKEGIWAANGINEANVAMSATETITSNPRVLGADPLVVYQPKKGNKKEVPGGIGEEDFLTIVLPYIKSAREGVLRLGSLLEKYGTYEMNGIAFADEDEVWWLETIGGHNWMAKRVKDDEYVIMPNQLGIDDFDFTDAYGKKKYHLCSKNLRQLVKDCHLDVNKDKFNPRYALGSHSDADHVYNTPRAWFIGRYFNPNTYKWDGENADFNPESDDIPWSLVPEKKITVEDIKYVLSSYYQGTKYNPFQKADYPEKGIYRPIGVSRTGVMGLCQIRGYMPKQLKGIHWVSFGPNPFNVCIPIYAWTNSIPKYLSAVRNDVSTDHLYWSSRLIGALADQHYGTCIQLIDRYQLKVPSRSYEILKEYDEKVLKSKKYELLEQANQEICDMCKKETDDTLSKVLKTASLEMKCGYSRADN